MRAKTFWWHSLPGSQVDQVPKLASLSSLVFSKLPFWENFLIVPHCCGPNTRTYLVFVFPFPQTTKDWIFTYLSIKIFLLTSEWHSSSFGTGLPLLSVGLRKKRPLRPALNYFTFIVWTWALGKWKGGLGPGWFRAHSPALLCCVLSYSVTSDSLWRRGLQPARALCPRELPGENTGVGCHCLLQGIFLTQGSICVSCIAGGFFTDWATGAAFNQHTLLFFFPSTFVVVVNTWIQL